MWRDTRKYATRLRDVGAFRDLCKVGLVLAVFLLLNDAQATDGSAILLKAGASPPVGWSLLVFTTDFGSGGRAKIGDSESCEISFANPCHFAVPDGQFTILIDVPLEFGDTTARLNVSGQRQYLLKSVLSGSRSAARFAGGVIGALLTQPDGEDSSHDPPKNGPDAPPLSAVRAGSRYDIELTSVGEPGSAVGFVRPPDTIFTFPSR